MEPPPEQAGVPKSVGLLGREDEFEEEEQEEEEEPDQDQEEASGVLLAFATKGVN